ncbi:hypothetical protein P8452_17431 [Trifolium repens]|nr:hypothetical protein P8452_17431 [Trifolium repens]
MVVLSDLMEIVENVNPPRITDSVQLDRDEQAIVVKVSLRIEEGLMSIEKEFQRAELAAKEEDKIIAEEKAAKELEDKRLAEEQQRNLLLWIKMLL